MSSTSSFTAGLKLKSSCPVVASSAARLGRTPPLTLVSSPPANTAPSEPARANTRSEATGFQPCSAPSARMNAAASWRLVRPDRVKRPPTYSRPLAAVSESTSVSQAGLEWASLVVCLRVAAVERGVEGQHRVAGAVDGR